MGGVTTVLEGGSKFLCMHITAVTLTFDGASTFHIAVYLI